MERVIERVLGPLISDLRSISASMVYGVAKLEMLFFDFYFLVGREQMSLLFTI